MVKTIISTDEVLNKLYELFTECVHRSGIPEEHFQQILAQGDAIANEMFTAVRRRIEALTGIRIRRVNTNRNRSPKEALKATGCNLCFIEEEVVSTMPRGEGDTIDVYFFEPRRDLHDDHEIETEYELRCLVPVDPYTLAAVNEIGVGFFENDNRTFWKDVDGHFCTIKFARDFQKRQSRIVSVYKNKGPLVAHGYFAGVPK